MRKKYLSALLCGTLMLSGVSMPVFGMESTPAAVSNSDIIHEGTIGSAKWVINSSGDLIIGPGEFTNIDDNYQWPWREFLGSVQHIDGRRSFKLSGSASGIFSCRDVSDHTVESVDLSGWDTSEVLNFESAFAYMSSLSQAELDTLDTSAAVSMEAMFDSCSSLEELNIQSWDVSNVAKMNDMFLGCSSLTKLDLSTWNTRSAEDLGYMFACCEALEELDISQMNASSANVDNCFMFANGLKTIRYSQNAKEMLKSLPVSYGWYQNSTGPYTIQELPDLSTPKAARLIQPVHQGTIGTAKWTMSSDGVLTIGEGQFEKTDSSYVWPWTSFRYEITEIDGSAPFKAIGSLSNIFHFHEDPSWFGTPPLLTKIDLSGWDTSDVTDMSFMFDDCSYVTDLNISSFDTSSVNSMRCMFEGVSSLKELDLRHFNTSNVTDMFRMFSGDRRLQSLHLESFETSKVHDMGMMFYRCENLTELNIESFDTSSVRQMQLMFEMCRGLTSLNLSGWDVSNVEDLYSIFEGCSKLKELDIRNWDTSAADVSNAFYDCSSLGQIAYGGRTQNLIEALSETSEGLWFQDGSGPYALSELPAVGENDYTEIVWMRTLKFIGDSVFEDLDSEYELSAEEVTPSFSLRHQGKLLKKDVDYTIEYLNNDSAGIATILCRGMGKYYGEIRTTFTIVDPSAPTPVSPSNIYGLNEEYEWTGSPICPSIDVIVDGKQMYEGIDYTVSYLNNIDPGNGEIYIRGYGDLDGAVSISFRIHKNEEPILTSIREADVSGVDPVYTYSGQRICPEPVVRLGGGCTF